MKCTNTKTAHLASFFQFDPDPSQLLHPDRGAEPPLGHQVPRSGLPEPLASFFAIPQIRPSSSGPVGPSPRSAAGSPDPAAPALGFVFSIRLIPSSFIPTRGAEPRSAAGSPRSGLHGPGFVFSIRPILSSFIPTRGAEPRSAAGSPDP